MERNDFGIVDIWMPYHQGRDQLLHIRPNTNPPIPGTKYLAMNSYVITQIIRPEPAKKPSVPNSCQGMRAEIIVCNKNLFARIEKFYSLNVIYC